MIVLVLLIAALIVFVLAVFGAGLVAAKMLALGLALMVGSFIAERVDTYRRPR